MRFFEFLRKSVVLQLVVGVLPVLLVLSFGVMLFIDIFNVYGTVSVNAKAFESDKSIKEVKEYSKDKEGKWSIKYKDGKKTSTDKADIVLFSDSDESKVYYSSSSSSILVPVGRQYYMKLLSESHVDKVLICWCLFCILLIYCVFRSDFVVLSKKCLVITNIIGGITVLLDVGVGYLIF